jgi:hydroxymethylpyrimidine pyrophosphatase-like HAD family hydrolase
VYYLGVATDGDGTLMRGSKMAKDTVAALRELRRSGRKLILVTGETADELGEFPHLRMFDCVVGENGGILYWPASGTQRRLSRVPPRRLVRALKREGLESLRSGRVVISLDLSARARVEELLRKLALRWHVVKNRRDIMILPVGVNKATGLARALRILHIPPARVLAVGDAENDGALFDCCGLGVAVGGAVPKLKRGAQLSMRSGPGRGFVKLIGRLLTREKELRTLGQRRRRRRSRRRSPSRSRLRRSRS